MKAIHFYLLLALLNKTIESMSGQNSACLNGLVWSKKNLPPSNIKKMSCLLVHIIYILHIFSLKSKPSYPDSRQFSILIMFIFLFFFFRNVPEIDPMSSMAVRMVPEQLPLRFPGLRFHQRLLSLLAPPDLLLNDLGWIPFKIICASWPWNHILCI